ncbi:serine/threonine protein kinase, CMGC group [Lobulomyces angularis]|nr:serine/threonine protein kinase, CMGC group [Lobulomyces angularis]
MEKLAIKRKAIHSQVNSQNSSFEKLPQSEYYTSSEEEDLSEEEEEEEDYKPGGYHPINVGDTFNDNRYVILRKLGWGHFSTVWLAKDCQLLRPVALKVVKSAQHYTETAIDEIKLLEKCCTANPASKHKHFVVELLDWFKHRGPNGSHVCMAFEVLGPNLLTLIRKYQHKGIEIPIVKRIAKQVLMGLDYLHRDASIIHTDLKPENVLVDIDVNAAMKKLGLDPTTLKPLRRNKNDSNNNSRKNQSLLSTPEKKNSKFSNNYMDDSDNVSLNSNSTSNTNYTSNSKVLTKNQKKKLKYKEKKKQSKKLHTIPNVDDLINNNNTSNHLNNNDKVPLNTENQKKISAISGLGLGLNPDQISPLGRNLSDITLTDKQIEKLRMEGEGEFHHNPLQKKAHISRSVMDLKDSFNKSGQSLTKKEIVLESLEENEESEDGEEDDEVDEKYINKTLLGKINENINVKIADLGNACWIDKHFSNDIQTRQYRAPEAILGAKYCTSADMWSFACMIFELLTGDYLFDPKAGSRYTKDDDHIAQIIELLGGFPKSIALSGKNVSKLRYWKLSDVLEEKYNYSKSDAIAISNFLIPALNVNPERRMTARELLNNEWLKEVKGDEVVAESDVATKSIEDFMKDGDESD